MSICGSRQVPRTAETADAACGTGESGKVPGPSRRSSRPRRSSSSSSLSATGPSTRCRKDSSCGAWSTAWPASWANTPRSAAGGTGASSVQASNSADQPRITASSSRSQACSRQPGPAPPSRSSTRPTSSAWPQALAAAPTVIERARPAARASSGRSSPRLSTSVSSPAQWATRTASASIRRASGASSAGAGKPSGTGTRPRPGLAGTRRRLAAAGTVPSARPTAVPGRRVTVAPMRRGGCGASRSRGFRDVTPCSLPLAPAFCHIDCRAVSAHCPNRSNDGRTSRVKAGRTTPLSVMDMSQRATATT